MIRDKYTFTEFVAALESDDFDKIEDNNLVRAKSFISDYPKVMETQVHGGDCTRESYSCPFCLMEHFLMEYKMYFFNEDIFRKEQGI